MHFGLTAISTDNNFLQSANNPHRVARSYIYSKAHNTLRLQLRPYSNHKAQELQFRSHSFRLRHQSSA